MNALLLATAIVIAALASPSPSNAGTSKTTKIKSSAVVPQPPKMIANQTHAGAGALAKCKKSGKSCVKSNGKFVTP